jgi:hypothetical protein
LLRLSASSSLAEGEIFLGPKERYRRPEPRYHSAWEVYKTDDPKRALERTRGFMDERRPPIFEGAFQHDNRTHPGRYPETRWGGQMGALRSQILDFDT